jgi:hypothetical protein
MKHWLENEDMPKAIGFVVVIILMTALLTGCDGRHFRSSKGDVQDVSAKVDDLNASMATVLKQQELIAKVVNNGLSAESGRPVGGGVYWINVFGSNSVPKGTYIHTKVRDYKVMNGVLWMELAEDGQSMSFQVNERGLAVVKYVAREKVEVNEILVDVVK